jgi:hypothetical protein
MDTVTSVTNSIDSALYLLSTLLAKGSLKEKCPFLHTIYLQTRTTYLCSTPEQTYVAAETSVLARLKVVRRGAAIYAVISQAGIDQRSGES